MDPIFSKRQLLQSVGQFLSIFLSYLVVFQKFSELSLDAMFQPIVQSLIGALAILGISRIPGGTNGAGK